MTAKKLAQKQTKHNSQEFEAFYAKFYAHADREELHEIPRTELESKADEAFEFIQSRGLDKPKIEIYNPEGQEKKPRTILMILNDNMPFLVDSVTAELNKFGLKIHEIYHPIINVKRDKNGAFQEFAKDGKEESLIYLQITHINSGEPSEALQQNMLDVLATVYVAVEDWKPMLAKQAETLASFKDAAKKSPVEDVKEAEDFFNWLADNHFTFLGYVEYNSVKGKMTADEKSRLGVFRSLNENSANIVKSEVDFFATSEEIIEITKSDQKAIVHRNVYMDQIGVKKFDDKGNVIGERWFTGLFASSAYFQTADTIPVIRRKVQYVLTSSGLLKGSHASKIAQFVLDSYPRDEIFQSSPDLLLSNTMAITDLVKRPRVGFFCRKDRFDRFMTCMIYIPKEKMDTNLRYRLQEIIEKTLDARISEYYTQITDSPLCRLYLIAKPNKDKFPSFDEKQLREKIIDSASVWTDQLMGELFAHFGEVEGDKFFRRYEHAFSGTYLAANNAGNAVYDIVKIEECMNSKQVQVEIYESEFEGEKQVKVKIFKSGSRLVLSDIMPVLENLGFRVITERPYTIKPRDTGVIVKISEFLLEPQNGKINVSEIKEIFETALTKLILGEVENDALNRLTIEALLPWRDVVLLRAYTKYYRQAGSFGLGYVREALVSNSEISALLVKLFYSQFDVRSKDKPEEIVAQIEEELKKVTSLNDDRILRWLTDAIQASLRTNFFQYKHYISIKFDSRKVPELPQPRPMFEVFVYSPDVEGIHLRGGMVARGGLRWSDRFEDFRTEVLGLIKAQMVKNSVIVPVGSKGGFIVKKKSEGQEDRMKNGIESYKTFLRGILDITDNVIEGKIVPPKDVVRRDKDDPYLVVAADKGTATFSDIANGISAEYNFWLGDAFASGGSAGYDHKAMGITARGGWISVMRHFREMGIDTQKQDFTCVGVGDMAGDVFGNGMLLSEHIRLVAAFNHMHIFIDPTPDAKASIKERSRLFKLPRSTWDDYDKSLISKGGGIFLRSAKSIKLTPEIKKALDIKADAMTPDELIRAILKSPVDLLWNGGIGTYIKATSETDRDVGDKGNDNLRINGADLRCKVIGEGGNLGGTQKGRIEAARAGVRLNTDAIDNSAGVDCSDHEVNIKIALEAAIRAKKLTLEERNKLLVEMTGEVSDLVLRDNYLQAQALTIAQSQGVNLLESQQSLMRHLESNGKLNREIEFLPPDDEIARLVAEKKGLTRPELSVVMAYAKISLYEEILESSVPDEEYFRQDLLRYFPEPMQEKYKTFLEGHQLRREIVATFISNSIVNRCGSTFFHVISRDTDMEAGDIARAYTVARDAYGLREYWKEIEALDGKIDYKIQADMFVRITKFIEHMTFWFLRNQPQPLDVAKSVKDFSKYASEFAAKLPSMLSETAAKHLANEEAALVAAGVPQSLANKIASLELLAASTDVAVVTNGGGETIAKVGKIYFEIGERLSISWLKDKANNLQGENYWQRVAIRNVIDALYEQQRRITRDIVKNTKSVEAWGVAHQKDLERHDKMARELKLVDKPDISVLVSATRRIESLGSL